MWTSRQINRAQTSRASSLAASELSVGMPINKRHQKRDLLLRQNLIPNKSLYKQIVGMVSQMISQILGREAVDEQKQSKSRFQSLHSADQEPSLSEDEAPNLREVRGIADRMPRTLDPHNPFPKRDLVLLGEAGDYPEPVIAIDVAGQLKPVFYEGHQVIARNLFLDDQRNPVEGRLLLSNGKQMPIRINVITAY
ncbi:MAG: hypothetical protein CR991_07880 [Proteobacteria bacterium]|nr:MAG: hypothetical protein CR991_07880 [Pseudomonadota bacterium]